MVVCQGSPSCLIQAEAKTVRGNCLLPPSPGFSISLPGRLEEGDSVVPWSSPKECVSLNTHRIAWQLQWWFLGLVIHFWSFLFEAACLVSIFISLRNSVKSVRWSRGIYLTTFYDSVRQLSFMWVVPNSPGWRRFLLGEDGFVDGCLWCGLDRVCEKPGFQAKSPFSEDCPWQLGI